MKICPDFDEDCIHVKNIYACWLGHPACITEDGLFLEKLDHANGLCPLAEIDLILNPASTVEEKQK